MRLENSNQDPMYCTAWKEVLEYTAPDNSNPVWNVPGIRSTNYHFAEQASQHMDNEAS